MFIGKFYQLFKELIPVLLKPFQKNVKEGTVPNSLFEASLTVISKPYRDTNYRSISLMNIDVNILNKISANQNQQPIKRIINHDHEEGNSTPLQYSCLKNPMD